MQGLSFNSIKKNPSLIPIYVVIVAGGALAAMYSLRLAFKSPDVAWTNKKEAEPWNAYTDKQYKFYSPVDFNRLKNKPPEY